MWVDSVFKFNPQNSVLPYCCLGSLKSICVLIVSICCGCLINGHRLPCCPCLYLLPNRNQYIPIRSIPNGIKPPTEVHFCSQTMDYCTLQYRYAFGGDEGNRTPVLNTFHLLHTTIIYILHHTYIYIKNVVDNVIIIPQLHQNVNPDQEHSLSVIRTLFASILFQILVILDSLL